MESIFGSQRATLKKAIAQGRDVETALNLLPTMLQGWREGADTVCAVRETRADESWAKRLGSEDAARMAPSPSGRGLG